MASKALAKCTLDMLLAVVPADDPERAALVARATAMVGEPQLLDTQTPVTLTHQVTWTFGSAASRASLSPAHIAERPMHGTSTNASRDRAGGTVPCIGCGALRRGPGDDCFEFSFAHNADATLVVCARCIFTEAAATERGQHPLRRIVDAYGQ